MRVFGNTRPGFPFAARNRTEKPRRQKDRKRYGTEFHLVAPKVKAPTRGARTDTPSRSTRAPVKKPG